MSSTYPVTKEYRIALRTSPLGVPWLDTTRHWLHRPIVRIRNDRIEPDHVLHAPVRYRSPATPSPYYLHDFHVETISRPMRPQWLLPRRITGRLFYSFPASAFLAMWLDTPFRLFVSSAIYTPGTLLWDRYHRCAVFSFVWQTPPALCATCPTLSAIYIYYAGFPLCVHLHNTILPLSI